MGPEWLSSPIAVPTETSLMTAPFQKVLIANRGEIARRVMRTCKRLGIATVAVYSEADADLPHVKDADEAYLIGGPAPKDSYLRIDALIEVLTKSGATAVHPGYGFLSEKAAFAEAVAAAGAVFVGPAPAMLEAFGDKMKARHVALAAGVSPVPGVDAPIDIATPEGLDAARSEAARIGYPILVKAVGGGGGIGMQVVKEEAGLAKALESCSNRGASAFADARVYLERYVAQPRHIEVQVFGDTHGQIFALGERECSLQRRHQKIVEESPSPAWFFQGAEGEARRANLLEAAVRIVRQVNYVGAGTCEFIADDKGDVFFLEVNARLQVEHPVTEMVTGLDLVEWQLRVAAGEKLPDWSSLPRNGHAIEARIYAEDPAKGFIPKPGAIDTLSWCGGEGEVQNAQVRIESGVAAGNKMTPYYDPMLAKVVAWAETRADALAGLDTILATSVVAPCTTNAAYVRAVLANEEFQAGRYDTQFAEPFAKAWAAANK